MAAHGRMLARAPVAAIFILRGAGRIIHRARDRGVATLPIDRTCARQVTWGQRRAPRFPVAVWLARIDRTLVTALAAATCRARGETDPILAGIVRRLCRATWDVPAVATDQVSRATDLDSRVEIDRAFLAIALEHRATVLASATYRDALAAAVIDRTSLEIDRDALVTGPASAIGRASAATDRDDQEGTSISATM